MRWALIIVLLVFLVGASSVNSTLHGTIYRLSAEISELCKKLGGEAEVRPYYDGTAEAGVVGCALRE